ncbi:hypothetical protein PHOOPHIGHTERS_40 [Serratia phage vB_SmaS_PhooPhighters]|uniref:Uncharacterized protein n=1 Tax=Serratia phage vB_SmaS_Rovert TaxID=2777363 RepID=A0A7T3N9T6_9CAUD|nr:hypothetical protein QJS24_gp33 [Serratia phage vB_SmaS_Rovert]QPX75001.1 hypothetical protein [Serratia phage vB_SmaS_Rovert]UGO51974.1 hypothetical protein PHOOPHIGHTERS_40 [Serratia phage vB_SmaS_PhooPhighters]
MAVTECLKQKSILAEYSTICPNLFNVGFIINSYEIGAFAPIVIKADFIF